MASALRMLAADMVNAAGSGHPGMPLGMADVATVLFRDHLRFDARDPGWFDRDRFVLSAGHGSALLYALAWLCGYRGVELDHLRRFRQLGSPAAGHPEHGHFPGVETTTGPLGQGLGTAVGMAIAEARLRADHGAEVCDHHTYAVVGDGCLMEGISHEAISLAGHLRLERLIVLWDDNRISIDGPTGLSTSDDQLRRFEASGWAAVRVDGHDPEAVSAALADARDRNRPSLIACRTTIGQGAPTMAGTAHVHGAPLGDAERAAMAAALGWDHQPFEMPDEVFAAWRDAGQRGARERRRWQARAATSELRVRLGAPMTPATESTIRARFDAEFADPAPVASRVSSQTTLAAVVPVTPALFGGSADLSTSNGTRVPAHRPFTPEDRTGNYVHYGVREHAMGAALNGLALHGGFVSYGGTFLAFADYCRPAIRLSALMGAPVVYVLTHDSIGVGEDGPTHQPVEHLDSLRAMPNLAVFRPADGLETIVAWHTALATQHTPTALVLSRQSLRPLPRETTTEADRFDGIARGGYVVREPTARREVTLIGTGSEVALALDAAELLAGHGISAAVVSLPCFERFVCQPPSYRAAVLGSVPRVGIEAGIGQSWWSGVLRTGDRFIGMTGFGASAPADQLYAHFGVTAQRMCTESLSLTMNGG
jgi:transketolase